MLLKLAFRNIWRSKRRTLLTICTIVCAVFLSILLQSFQKGSWDNIINSSVKLFFGYAQIHKNGYWKDKLLDDAMSYDQIIKDIEKQTPEIKGVVPRIESFALASVKNKTHGVMLVGIDPEKENKLTGIKNKIIEGKYLTTSKNEIIIGEGVSKKLNLVIGDTLVLISQGYRGAQASGKYAVSGIFKYALPDLNKTLVFLPLETAQEFYAAENLVTSVTLDLKLQDLPTVMKSVENQIGSEQYEIMDYKKLLPELEQARSLDEASSSIFLTILYGLISFTIFGTILMMIKERNYEFGILISIGMNRWMLFLIVFLEIIIMGVIGAITGMLLAFPLVYYLHKNPIDLTVLSKDAMVVYEKFAMEPVIPVAFTSDIFLNQTLLIFIITCILGIYPLLKISKLNAIKAIKEQ